jgi:hypothetical protein
MRARSAVKKLQKSFQRGARLAESPAIDRTGGLHASPRLAGFFCSERSSVMQSPAKHLGYVRVWRDGDQWRWCPVGKWAPEEAELGDRYRTEDGEEVINIQSGTEARLIRGAVKAS